MFIEINISIKGYLPKDIYMHSNIIDLMTLAKLEDFNFRNKRVLVRVDFNVPLDDDGNIMNDKRMRESIPTIQYLLDEGAQQIIMMSHLGRPKGKVVQKLKMDKIAEHFSKLIGQEVAKADGCADIDMPYGRLILLENLRFYKAEKSKIDFKRQEFAKNLADYADIYVNDGFGTCHRKHASNYDITKYIPGCIGKLVEKELRIIGDALESSKKPFVAVMGGAKVSDKFGAIKILLKKVDSLLLGGAMVFTFYKAMGKEVGKSLVEDHMVDLAKELLIEAKDRLVLPTDIVCAEEASEDAAADVCKVNAIPADMKGLDIGPETINYYKDIIIRAQTVVWNGPMGMCEIEQFALGTNEIAKAMVKCPGVTILGGGDTEAAVEKIGIEKKITHISTGGGASLELFEGKKLIAIEALEKNYKKFHKAKTLSKTF